MKYFLIILFMVAMTFAQSHRCNHLQQRYCSHISHEGTPSQYQYPQEYVNVNAGPGDTRVTVIKVVDTTGNYGDTQLYRELLDECYTDIPDINAVEGHYTHINEFAKGINQVPHAILRNDWIKKHEATVQVNYMLRQTVLIVATTKSIDAKDPVFRKVHKKQRRSITFKSRQENGPHYAGRSKRFYYHPTKKTALHDAQDQARIWLSQQEAVMCELPFNPASR